ncbi:hypothetical protein [Legionella worsleiensis]|uniref:Uncharacterized protein n=1 Tax=Legionella worsleiensis TaxID=45076 RepID=A0A0W1AJP3_9GAMM|nr:hypothetical protein [Legionella worsleiensis]KTD81508.1 hypothetical protein Lwor_0546 [Legionella worsleiensis]STY32067.1 Uncharacterised protein [Legionella worsleiensis]
MFRKFSKDYHLTAQDFHDAIQNFEAQKELVSRQRTEGTLSKHQAQEELQRLSSLISSYRQNMESALEAEQGTHYSPR